ncbi:MAG: phosphoglycerate kinase [Rhodovibrionaceae bacterium]
MPAFLTLDDLDLAGKSVLLRCDFNVPMKGGEIGDDTRLRRALPTIREIVEAGGKAVLLSHFGRPKGQRVPELSLKPVAAALGERLGQEVAFAEDCIGAAAERAVAALPAGGVLLLENLRFHTGEEANDGPFAEELAALGDLYVNDAFSAAHRAHASVEALPRRLPAAAGRLMQEELEHLTQALESPTRPLAAIVGGAKVSTKLALLGNLVEKVDVLIIGGGMANTFLHAQGVDIGASLCEREMTDTVAEILKKAKAAKCEILLPADAEIAAKLESGAAHETVPIAEVPSDKMILDCGPKTAQAIGERLADCKTLVWNGPLGAFEVPPFDAATSAVAATAAELTRRGELLTVAGGGDTVAALAQAGVLEDFSYVSTAGGAFLEWLEGKTLPGVQALEDAAKG